MIQHITIRKTKEGRYIAWNDQTDMRMGEERDWKSVAGATGWLRRTRQAIILHLPSERHTVVNAFTYEQTHGSLDTLLTLALENPNPDIIARALQLLRGSLVLPTPSTTKLEQ